VGAAFPELADGDQTLLLYGTVKGPPIDDCLGPLDSEAAADEDIASAVRAFCAQEDETRCRRLNWRLPR
jgi:hypothetical protein